MVCRTHLMNNQADNKKASIVAQSKGHSRKPWIWTIHTNFLLPFEEKDQSTQITRAQKVIFMIQFCILKGGFIILIATTIKYLQFAPADRGIGYFWKKRITFQFILNLSGQINWWLRASNFINMYVCIIEEPISKTEQSQINIL